MSETAVSETPEPLCLRIVDAVTAWCDVKLVNAVRIAEELVPDLAPRKHGRPSLLAAPLGRDDGHPNRHRASTEAYRLYEDAWEQLERDLRTRLETGTLYVEGVLVTKDMQSPAQLIRGALAANFRFDFLDNTLRHDMKQFVGLRFSRDPANFRATFGEATAGVATPEQCDTSTLNEEQVLALLLECVSRVIDNRDAATLGRFKRVLQPIIDLNQVGQVAELAPEVVATLLERHAEHVRTGLRVELAPPGKASVLALAASMMEHRARTGQLRPDMAEEAQWLSRWAAQVAPSYAQLGPKRLQNTLGSLFRDLQAEQLARPAPSAGDVAPK